MKICGAKLEVCVCAKTDGRIQLRAKPGDKVIPNTLVALVEWDTIFCIIGDFIALTVININEVNAYFDE